MPRKGSPYGPGYERARLRSEDWEVRGLPSHAEAARIIRGLHYSGSTANTSVYRHGLFPVGLLTECVGVAMWMPPTRRAGEAVAGDEWRGVLALSRFVIAPEVPKNAASFLLARSRKLIDRGRWPVLLSYADTNEGHTGGIYRADNWTCEGPVPAGDVWQMPDGSLCGRKRGRVSLTVGQMRAMGAIRRPSAPKIRFTHRAS